LLKYQSILIYDDWISNNSSTLLLDHNSISQSQMEYTTISTRSHSTNHL